MGLKSICIPDAEWICLPVCICILKVINSKQAQDTMMVDVIQSCKAVVVASMWNYGVFTESFCAWNKKVHIFLMFCELR